MGAFAEYIGYLEIAEEKREEYRANMLRLLNLGGMMQLDEVNMYGKKVMLVSPLTFDKEKSLYFDYNYFEDEVWEDAGFDGASERIWSGKIGGDEFADVMSAAYVLEELYSEDLGVAEDDGDPVDAGVCTAWINNILGTDFSIAKRFRLWDYFEKRCLSYSDKTYASNWGLEYILSLMPSDLGKAMGSVELADIFLIAKGTYDIAPEDIQPGSYPEVIYQCKCAFTNYIGNATGDDSRAEKIEVVRNLVRSNRTEREKVRGELKQITEFSLKMSARALIYIMTETCNLNFWDEWDKIRQDCYTDEDTNCYTSKSLKEWRDNKRKEAVEPVRTEWFLRQDGPFTFRNTPEELKNKPQYYLSDDDRAFWWDGTDEVIFSERMECWLGDLAERHKQIMEKLNLEGYDKEDFLCEMTEALVAADEYYKRIFPFQGMFFEFLQNGSDKRYIAAIKLFEELCESNKESGKIIEVCQTWRRTSKTVKCNAGRMNIKRYLGVMANKKLRKIHFGF